MSSARVNKSSRYGTLYAGIARVDITPPLSVPLHHPLREGATTDVERPLTATALVLADGTPSETAPPREWGCKVAIVACDLISLCGTYADRMRTRVSELLDMSPDHVLINCSHTHAVPSMPGWQAQGEPPPAGPLARYHDWLLDAVPGAVLQANNNLQPARAGVGRGAVRIGINRRELLPDGTVILGENPDGPIDDEVSVVRLDTVDGQPLALVMNYACHADVLGPRVSFVSPDWVGHARAAAESLIGAPALFLQGAAGDVDPVSGIPLGPDGSDEIHRLGLQVGAEAAKVFAGIRTHRQRGERQIFRSMSDGLSMWQYTDVTDPALTALRATTRRLLLPLQPFPSQEAAQAEVDHWQQELFRLRQSAGPQSKLNLAERHLSWSQLQLDAVRSGQKPEAEMELQAIRLNDIGLVAIPGEPFVEIGLNIKCQSPLAHTLVCGYSNGCLVYIPTAEAFAYGGYEVKSHKNYMLPSAVTPEWAGTIEAAALEMLAELVEE